MNALVKKEVRQLLPSFCACCALALPNLFFRFNADGSLHGSGWFVLAFVFCGAMAVMLGLASFGGEMGSGTFSNLLAQPVSRQKIWDTKIGVLAISFLIVGIVWSACGIWRLDMLGRDLKLLDLFTGIGTFGLVVFSGGLWTVLLLRQVAAAFWFTVLVPAMMLVLVSGLFGDDEFAMGVLVCVLGTYSLGGFFFARWLFFRAQDLQWSGGAILLPETRGLARFKLRSALRAWHPRSALWRKEFALQQSQFVMAFALLVLHLGVLATRKFGSFQRNSATELILESFWGLWLVLPMLVGAAAVAEERKLGTLAVHLCQPVKRRAQFEIKFCTVLLLSTLFGVVVPFVLEGSRILPDIDIFSDLPRYLENNWETANAVMVLVWYVLTAFNSLLPVLALLSLSITIGAISFYASTLARNTLQALAPAVLGFVCFVGLLAGAFRPELLFHYPLWHGLLIYFIGLPVLAVAGLVLSFWNWQQPEIGLTTVWRNLAGWVATLACIMLATTAIYHRSWEKLTAFEPAHGPAQLSLAKPPVLRGAGNSFSVQLPDGRAWVNYWEMYAYPVSLNPLSALLGNLRLTNSGSVYSIGRTNNFVKGFRAVVQQSAGINAEGTLWVWEPVATMVQTEAEKRKVNKEMKLVQFGSETNWSSLAVARHELSLLLVKQDGTLWRWGVTNVNWDSHTNWPGLRSFPPQRLGTETNWAEVFEAGDKTFLRKTDGTIWTTWINDQGEPKITLEPRFTVECATVWGRAKWRSHTVIYGYNHSSFRLGVLDDGSFRILADQRFNHHTGDYDWKPANLALGHETNWLAVAGTGENVVTLKSDGTLWLWNFQPGESRGGNPERDEQLMLHQNPIRLGAHADWVGITSAESGIISLAADGSLWYWPLESAEHFGDFGASVFNDYNPFGPLLDLSRKPQSLGNLFGVKAGQLATATQ